jgi:hypothetical protein
MGDSLHDQALRLSAVGVKVYPLFPVVDGRCGCGDTACQRAGAHPRTARGALDRTDNQAQVRLWWVTNPDSGIGVVDDTVPEREPDAAESTAPAAEAPPDYDGELRRFVALMFSDGGMRELRALEVERAAYPLKNLHSEAGLYRPEDMDKLLAAITHFRSGTGTIDRLPELRSCAGVYYTLNAVKAAAYGKAPSVMVSAARGISTGDADIERRTRLLIDVDAPRGVKGVPATDSEKVIAFAVAKKVRLFLNEMGFPDPIRIDSGNGAQLVYAVDLPADDGGLVDRFLKALAAKFDNGATIDQSVHNAARIARMPTTWNRKAHHTDERPHRLARAVAMPASLGIVPRDLLEEVAAMAPQPETNRNGHAGDRSEFDAAVQKWNAAHPVSWSRHCSECPICGSPDGLKESVAGPSRWACFSSRHVDLAVRVDQQHGIGRKGNGVHTGDALDVEAFRSGRTRAQALRDDGYLGDRSNGAPASGADHVDGKEKHRKSEPEREPPQPVLLRMSEVQPQPIPWLWKHRIPTGRLTLVAGVPGQGKSFLTIDAAARISTGRNWPDGHPCQQGSVVLVSCEDDPADTIRPRLDACRADTERVHVLTGVRRNDSKKKKKSITAFTLADLEPLECTLQQIDDVRLVVIDPIGSYFGISRDSSSDTEVRSLLSPLADLARQFHVAIVLIAHTRKSAGMSADETVMGSRAFTGLARAVHHVVRDPGDRHRRLLLPGKCNLAVEPKGLGFRLLGDPVPEVKWDGQPVTVTADEVFAQLRQGGGGDKGSRATAEADWLRDILKNGPVLTSEVEQEAKTAGFAWRTVQEAASIIAVPRRRDGYGGKYWWHPPAM